MIQFGDSEIKKINQALAFEKKAIIDKDFDLKKLSCEEILYICECLSGFVSEDDNYFADKIISKLLKLLELRGDMK